MVWEEDFDCVCNRIGKHFSRTEARNHVRSYLAALLATNERRNGWQLAKAIGSATPYALQHILGRSVWDADEVRDDLRRFVSEQLFDLAFVMWFGELGFSKKGAQSAGVKRQFNWTTQRIENCQVGVFLACTKRGCCMSIDRELYLPETWTRDQQRRRRAGIPDGLNHASKPELGRRMLLRALDAGLRPAWVVSEVPQDSDATTLSLLEDRQQPYILALDAIGRSKFEISRGPLDKIAASLPPSAWVTIKSESPLFERHEWSTVMTAQFQNDFHRAIVMRRDCARPDRIDYYVAFAPIDTPLRQIAMIARGHAHIDKENSNARSEVGLDQYEVRSWNGWYRHVTRRAIAGARPSRSGPRQYSTGAVP